MRRYEPSRRAKEIKFVRAEIYKQVQREKLGLLCSTSNWQLEADLKKRN